MLIPLTDRGVYGAGAAGTAGAAASAGGVVAAGSTGGETDGSTAGASAAGSAAVVSAGGASGLGPHAAMPNAAAAAIRAAKPSLVLVMVSYLSSRAKTVA